MKRTALDPALLILGALAYFGYLVTIIFVMKSHYEFGLYLFTPLFLYTIFRVLNARIKRASLLLALYLALPFFTSVWLTLIGAAPVWEVTGALPIAVLFSFSLKSEKSSSPLFTSLLEPIYALFFALTLFLPLVNFINNRDIVPALQLMLAIYSPALVLTTVIVFLRFIIETASLNMVLNSFRLFIHGAKVDRLLFDSAQFLSLGQVNLSGIITAEGVSRDLFLKKVNLLNKEFAAADENNDIMKRDAKFSRKMADGTELTIGTLYLLIKKEKYRTDGLALPPDLTAKSFVAMAEGNRVIGYYVIDRFDATANRTMIDLLREKYGIASALIGTADERFPAVPAAATLAELMPGHHDMLITQTPPDDSPCIVVGWGGAAPEKCDLYLNEPYLITLMKLFLLLTTIRPRLYRSVAIASIPFILPLFLSIFKLHVPQLNAVAVLLMMLLTITQAFRSVKAE
ncbi:MAG TPA: hypothetical protein PLV42_12945 [bacterium]|nr:hypothetical protein [bacterium]